MQVQELHRTASPARQDSPADPEGLPDEYLELEATLKECTGVADAGVILLAPESRAVRVPIAFVELQAGVHSMLPRHVKALVAQRLPRHLWPAQVRIVDRIPRLADASVDRQRLAEMDAAARRRAASLPRHAWMPDVLRIFEETLGVTGVTPEDSLLSLGATSLQAMQVASKLEARFGMRFLPAAFESAESIDHLVRFMTYKPRVAPGQAMPSSALRASGPHKLPYLTRLAKRAFEAWKHWGAGTEVWRKKFRHDVSLWAGNIQYLMRIGALDVALEEVQRLNTLHPGMPVAEDLGGILRAMPAANGAREPFRDDPERALQVNRCDHADTVLFVFCGALDGCGVPLPVFHRWIGQLPLSVVYLRDFRRSHYFAGLPRFGTGLAATVAGLRALAKELGASRILCWGNSAGAPASLKYGIELGAERVIALDGTYDFTREFNLCLDSAWNAARVRTTYPESDWNLRQRYFTAQQRPRSLLAYGEGSWDDRIHAEHMGDIPGVHLLRVNHRRNHCSLNPIIARGWMEPVLAWLTTGAPLGHVLDERASPQRPRQA
jgi:acyl carrier protein